VTFDGKPLDGVFVMHNEEELRNWFKLDEREDGHYFYPFDDFVQLREVIIGPLCATQKEDIEDALKTWTLTALIRVSRSLASRSRRAYPIGGTLA
jgi:hypothetical protein